jgi:hypothetical protein
MIILLIGNQYVFRQETNESRSSSPLISHLSEQQAVDYM